MSQRDYWIEQIQRYAEGQLDAAEIAALSAVLREDAVLRRDFLELLNLDSALDEWVASESSPDGFVAGDSIEMRQETAIRSSDVAPPVEGLLTSGNLAATPLEPTSRPGKAVVHLSRLSAWSIGVGGLAVILLVAAGIWWSSWKHDPRTEVAWLFNAQDCRWSGDGEPTGSLMPGRIIALDSGLIEIHFRSGANIVLQGPGRMELVSASSARLLKGKLAAHVPPQAHGFQILSPYGKVIDLGTEFGFSVSDDGDAKVVVFTGEVNAYSDRDAGHAVNLVQQQVARIDSSGVALESQASDAESAGFVRVIEPRPTIVPRTLSLDFRRSCPGSLQDRSGNGIGFTHRMPGTGSLLEKCDEHLRLNTKAGQLEVTTTESDLNGAYQLDRGEYFGVRLADLGFTGQEDFEITATFLNTPALASLNQFGLYAGTGNTSNFRGGMIAHSAGQGQATQFVVNHDGACDEHPQYVGIAPHNSDIVLTLRRIGGRYSLKSENRTTNASVTVTTTHPEFLDGAKGIEVGLFGANTRTKEPCKLIVKELKVTVWTVAAPAKDVAGWSG